MLKTKSINSQFYSLLGHTTSEPICFLKFMRCRREGEKERFLLAWEDYYQTSIYTEAWTLTINEVYWSMNFNNLCPLCPIFHKLLQTDIHMHTQAVLNILSLDLNYPVCNDEGLVSNTPYFIILLWFVSRCQSHSFKVTRYLSLNSYMISLQHIFRYLPMRKAAKQLCIQSHFIPGNTSGKYEEALGQLHTWDREAPALTPRSTAGHQSPGSQQQ